MDCTLLYLSRSVVMLSLQHYRLSLLVVDSLVHPLTKLFSSILLFPSLDFIVFTIITKHIFLSIVSFTLFQETPPPTVYRGHTLISPLFIWIFLSYKRYIFQLFHSYHSFSFSLFIAYWQNENSTLLFSAKCYFYNLFFLNLYSK